MLFLFNGEVVFSSLSLLFSSFSLDAHTSLFVTFVSVHQFIAVASHAIRRYESWRHPYIKKVYVCYRVLIQTISSILCCILIIWTFWHFEPSVNVRLSAPKASAVVEKPAVALVCPFTANDSCTWPAAEKTWNGWKQCLPQKHIYTIYSKDAEALRSDYDGNT